VPSVATICKYSGPNVIQMRNDLREYMSCNVNALLGSSSSTSLSSRGMRGGSGKRPGCPMRSKAAFSKILNGPSSLDASRRDFLQRFRDPSIVSVDVADTFDSRYNHL